MKRTFFWLTLLLVAVVLLAGAEPAWAAPGGKIALGLFKSTWGKVLLGLLTIIFLPLVLYVAVKEHMAERKTLKHLRALAAVDPRFEWLNLKDRITDCFHRVHAAWRAEDMAEAAEWMTSWYWQNQQLAFLNQWARDGLVNHCRVKSVGSIRPLFVGYEANEECPGENSRVVVSITANMEDYLAERATGKIVEGSEGYADTEFVWTFVLKNGRWVVANIEEGSMALTYAEMRAEIPETLPDRAPARKFADHPQ
jgi:hypothetical protein